MSSNELQCVRTFAQPLKSSNIVLKHLLNVLCNLIRFKSMFVKIVICHTDSEKMGIHEI